MSEGKKWNVVSLNFKEGDFKESLVLSTDISLFEAQRLCQRFEEKYRDTTQVFCVVPAGTVQDYPERKPWGPFSDVVRRFQTGDLEV